MEFAIILILTLLNGYFAMSETALVSVKKSRVAHKAEKGNARAKIILQLHKHPENFLSSIQLGITLIGIVAGAYGGTMLAGKVAPYIGRIDALAPYAFEIAITLLVILITYFTIVVGELIPKTLALRNTLGIAMFVAPSIRFFTSITYPLVRLLSGTTNFIIKILRINPKNSSQTVTEEELRHMLRVAGQEGVLEHEEEQIHQNIFSLYDQRNSSLMTLRANVIWIEANAPVKAIHETILQSPHSKFPVCEGTIDHIVGILSAKDFLAYMSNPDFSLSAILKKPVFVSDSMLAVNTLRLFRQEKQYLGVVVDEHSAVEGIITLHDIMEAIVGDIPDIGEEAEPDMYVREDGSVLISGTTSVVNLNEYLGYMLIPENSRLYTTLAGFILHQISRIPRVGDKLILDGYLLEVIDMDGTRIDKILLNKSADGKPQLRQ
ncbi:putative hemolysin [Pontibacter aydingkolensis]|uniref:Hemolysin family protein n=1 Tax=Pontibacter aydingkolensis TaxID=1911536 RepID=A0ABS7CPU5_9BACT|nr:hemolysin family protein [Pontibacter aydingkolensis]MBW7465823.1 hemolysin family protein [Pontibacter aydingkolensis]